MKLTIKTFLGAVCLAIGFLSAQDTASAVPITGGISFSGQYTPQNNSGMTVTDLTLATQIAFPDGGFPNGQYTAGTGTGSFSTIAAGTTVNMAPLLKFAAPQNLPITAFYSVGTFTFDLLTVAVMGTTTSNALTLTGTGTFHGAGFTDTAGSYIATFNTAAGTYSFSASGAALPDGGTTVALMGLGLVAVEISRRLLNARSLKA